MPGAFPPDTLALLSRTLEITLRAGAHRAVIWIVVADGAAYIRSYRGAKGRWFAATVADGRASLEIAGQTIAVRAVPVNDAATQAAISAVYSTKYATSPYLAAMLGPQALETTLRIVGEDLIHVNAGAATPADKLLGRQAEHACQRGVSTVIANAVPPVMAFSAAEARAATIAAPPIAALTNSHAAQVPEYLRRHYWWAYVHPWAVRIFERPWLVNLILWGNYRRLCEAALAALGPVMSGRTVQLACVYGDLTNQLADDIAEARGSLDVIDVLPVQLANLREKLDPHSPVRLLQQDTTALAAADGSYDRALLFFLLHEQPEEVRARTLAETMRVVRPGGRVVIVDFARPSRWHPMRYFWLPILNRLEPFASGLWADEGTPWLPPDVGTVTRTAVFGGLYQIVTIDRPR